MNRLKTLMFFLVVASMLVTACGGAATQAPPEAVAPTQAPPTEAPAPTEAALPTEPPTEAVVPTEAPAPTAAEEVTLVDWGYTGDIQTKLFGEKMANPFMESHPGV